MYNKDIAIPVCFKFLSNQHGFKMIILVDFPPLNLFIDRGFVILKLL